MSGDGDWHVTLTRDGTVLAAIGAPPTCVGQQLPNCADLPDDAREAVRTLLASHGSSTPIIAAVSLRSIRKTLHLVVVEALPVRRASTDIRAVLHASLDAFQQQANEHDVALDLFVEDRVPQLISLDADKVAWATSALVGNALRYVRRGTRVMPGGSIAVRVTYSALVPEIAVEVQDDGPGIPAEKLPILFSAGADRPRAGLGLLMVRDIVAAHAGHLEVESDPALFGRGTRIRLTLPVSSRRMHDASPDLHSI